jgi:hypothetical protein
MTSSEGGSRRGGQALGTISSKAWWATLALGTIVAIGVAAGTIALASAGSDLELRKTLYGGAVTLSFTVVTGGLFGALLKVATERAEAARTARATEEATLQRRRDDAAAFVKNVLSDLKSVYDGVARVRRALQGGADGVREPTTRRPLDEAVDAMESYLETLTSEFRDSYKDISDEQRLFEARADAAAKGAARSGSAAPLDNEPWARLQQLLPRSLDGGDSVRLVDGHRGPDGRAQAR